MSTNDVPGSNPINNDILSMGSWAEHKDGSLILVESTEGDRIIYSMFDMSKEPPIEYRDAMPKVSFEKTFSWSKDKSSTKNINEKWEWHDKTPFLWDRIIKKGFPDGGRLPSAEHVLSAAERIAESLRLKGETIEQHRVNETRDKMNVIWGKLSRALDEFLK